MFLHFSYVLVLNTNFHVFFLVTSGKLSILVAGVVSLRFVVGVDHFCALFVVGAVSSFFFFFLMFLLVFQFSLY